MLFFASFTLCSLTGTYAVAQWLHACKATFGNSLDHTNNQASNSHRTHEAVVVEFRRRA